MVVWVGVSVSVYRSACLASFCQIPQAHRRSILSLQEVSVLHASEHATLSPIPEKTASAKRDGSVEESGEWMGVWVGVSVSVSVYQSACLASFFSNPSGSQEIPSLPTGVSALSPVPDQRQPLLRGMGVWRKVVSELVCLHLCIHLLVSSCISFVKSLRLTGDPFSLSSRCQCYMPASMSHSVQYQIKDSFC